MTTYFKQIKIEIASHADVKRPELDNKKSFFCIYSPKSFMFRPRDDMYLDLKIKVDAPKQLEAWINLLPSLKERGFKLEDHNWTSNKLKDDTIQLHILNKNFTKTIHIKKDQEIAYMFLLGQKFNEKIITEYSFIT